MLKSAALETRKKKGKSRKRERDREKSRKAAGNEGKDRRGVKVAVAAAAAAAAAAVRSVVVPCQTADGKWPRCGRGVELLQAAPTFIQDACPGPCP